MLTTSQISENNFSTVRKKKRNLVTFNSVETYYEIKMGKKLSSSYTNTNTDLHVFLTNVDFHQFFFFFGLSINLRIKIFFSLRFGNYYKYILHS